MPVPEINKFKTYPSYFSKNKQPISNYIEPAQEENRYSGELEEYNNMYNSVKINQGFYVARFEAGREKDKVVSKKNAEIYNDIKWGDGMNVVGTDGAVAKAKNMYTDRKKYDVTSTLIYGTQWDAIMLWIDPNYENSECDTENSFVANSTDKGNYSGRVTNSGINEQYKIKNIYDLAANVSEWTMEAASNRQKRIERGGYCTNNGEEMPASYRVRQDVPYHSEKIGFRVALYL